MSDEEEFGKITIDDQPVNKGWNKPIPYLSSWDTPYNASGLTKEQSEFYQFLKESIERGEYLQGDNLRGYLYMYDQELRQAYNKRSNNALQQIINFVSLYHNCSYPLSEIIEKEEDRQRKRRLNFYKIKDKAYWVPVGQELTVEDRKFVRGGFYLGKYIDFFQYNPKTERYAPAVRFEGPAISLDKPNDKPKVIKSIPYCFAELNEQQQQSLLNWLAGANEIDIVALAVYLSGFEVRLFGDKTTSDTERLEDIQYLYHMLSNLPVITDVNPDADGGSAFWQDYATKWITNLIDFTLARYYIDSAETVLPIEFVDKLSILSNARIDRGFANITVTGRQQSELAQEFKQFVKPPRQLPEVFHPAFYDKLAYDYQNNAHWHMADFGVIDRSGFKYNPIYFRRQYKPQEQIESLLHVEPMKYSIALGKTAEKLKLVYGRMMRGLGQFMTLVDKGAPLLQQVNSLPSWCDASLMPEVGKIVEELSPTPNQRYKLMKVSDLIKYFSNIPQKSDSPGDSTSVYVDQEMVDYVRMSLYRMGLAMAYPTSATMGLKYDDTTAIYDKSHPEVPSRGTIQTSIFLIAWMIQAEKVTEADYAIIDQWLREAAGGSKWDVSAEAVMRWLVNHKLTMTAKRKIRARALAKFANKREQLMNLLLVLVNGEGFVLPKRMKRLETIYELVGLDPSTIHSDLHRRAIEGIKKDARSSKTTAKKGKATGSAGMLNRDKLKEIEQSTAKAQEILADVFTQENENEQVKKKASSKKKKADSIVTLIEKLAQKPEWTRAEFEELISKQGETYGAMLEKLNDYSYDKVDEAIVEDDGDTLYVDTDVANMLLE